MERKRKAVKSRRPYDSSKRAAQASQSRAAILDCAERLFLESGYAATTIAAVAEAAGVSVETIYKAFGGKAGLVRAIRERRLGGVGPVPAETRSDRARASTADPYALIAAWGVLATEVAPLVSPILLLVRAAAVTDPDVAELLAEMDADRLRRMRVNARHLRDGGHLRPDVTLAQAVDVLWTYSAPELYELLVLRRSWSLVRYGRFIADAMIAALLPARPTVRLAARAARTK
jgi:AcrR family transcriptional regulator